MQIKNPFLFVEIDSFVAVKMRKMWQELKYYTKSINPHIFFLIFILNFNEITNAVTKKIIISGNLYLRNNNINEKPLKQKTKKKNSELKWHKQ